ncbi:hypothetical protein ACHAWF_002223 [Thalassiosira exigua]
MLALAAAIAITCLAPASSLALAPGSDSPPVAVPEVRPDRLSRVARLVSSALGDDDGGDREASRASGASSSRSPSRDRYACVREAVSDFAEARGGDGPDEGVAPPTNELVYGELSVPVLATILDAAGVREGDVFLDIGSGDGALVLGASLLYADDECGKSGGERGGARMINAIRKAFGVEIVPGLVDRSRTHADCLRGLLQEGGGEGIAFLGENQAEVDFLLGDVHEPDGELRTILGEVTLVVCFATTWSAGNAFLDATQKRTTSLQGRRLPKLSRSLSAHLARGCRVVIIDGRLDPSDGFVWEGDLRIQCPDTAPYSVASLYCKQ